MLKKLVKTTKKKIKKERIPHIVTVILSAGFFIAGVFILWFALIPLPDFQSFEQRKVEESTKIYDRTGKVLLFYEHRGVKPTAIFRALITNFLSFNLRGQGGSTITQQVVKLTLLTNEKKYIRKLKEAILAIKLEQVISKDEILNMYLNEAPYGGSLYGVEEASVAFFGKKSKDILLAEAAYMAALPQAPTYYSPYGKNIEDLEARKNTVLDRMEKLGFITSDEAKLAKQEVVLFAPHSEQGIKAPHFVMYVIEYLEQKYGRDAIETQGLKVTTTLDWGLQQKAEKIVTEYSKFNAENFNANNAGVVAINPKTGEILVMVGSKDYFNTKEDGNFNVTTAQRQPGSAFKPFVYETAFKKGYTPETVVFDLPTQFSSLCDAYGKPWSNSTN